jgi:hypothetical protein
MALRLLSLFCCWSRKSLVGVDDGQSIFFLFFRSFSPPLKGTLLLATQLLVFLYFALSGQWLYGSNSIPNPLLVRQMACFCRKFVVYPLLKA